MTIPSMESHYVLFLFIPLAEITVATNKFVDTIEKYLESQYRSQLSLLQQQALKTLAQSGFPSPIWQTK